MFKLHIQSTLHRLHSFANISQYHHNFARGKKQLEKVSYLLIIGELNSGSETMHKFPLLNDGKHLLTFSSLTDKVLQCIPDVVCCWLQISGSDSL